MLKPNNLCIRIYKWLEFNKKTMLKKTWNIISAVAVRVILMVHCFLAVWRAADVRNNDLYWLMALTNVFMVAEGIFRIVKKESQESKW